MRKRYGLVVVGVVDLSVGGVDLIVSLLVVSGSVYLISLTRRSFQKTIWTLVVTCNVKYVTGAMSGSSVSVSLGASFGSCHVGVSGLRIDPCRVLICVRLSGCVVGCFESFGGHGGGLDRGLNRRICRTTSG